MSQREQFLEEMGLAPIWRSRAARPVESKSVEQPAVSRGAESAAVKPAIPARPSAVPSRPVVAVARGDAPAASAAQDERAIRIARMPMDELKSEVAKCTACDLCQTRKNTVFGVGDEAAQWMIVGEAPGAEEDATGEPFVGQAGKLLDNMLASIDLARGKNVYIANVLKCRPPGNRNPQPGEVSCCAPFLQRQIALVQPKLLIAMGRFAAQALLASDAAIGNMRGKVYRYQGVPTVVTYHPAYLLRTLQEKAKSWEDLCFARDTFAGPAQ